MRKKQSVAGEPAEAARTEDPGEDRFLGFSLLSLLPPNPAEVGTLGAD